MKRIFQAIQVLLLLVATACGVASGAEPVPPTIHYGQDICAFCGMIINEERFAAAYVADGGQGYAFDDIGGMVQFHLQRQGTEEVAAFFVHDYETGSWIRAETASYLLSDEFHTPMLSGLAAFASIEQARALEIEFQGQALTFDEVLRRYQEIASTATNEEEVDYSHNHK